MSSYMERETFLFLIAAGTGAGLFLFYRSWEFFAGCFRGGDLWRFFDLLYWILSGSVVFAELYQYNEGVFEALFAACRLFGGFFDEFFVKEVAISC